MKTYPLQMTDDFHEKVQVAAFKRKKTIKDILMDHLHSLIEEDKHTEDLARGV